MSEENSGMEYVYGLARKRIAALEKENAKLHQIIQLAAQDLSLLVAKTACGKDRTAIRMTKYLNAEAKK